MCQSRIFCWLWCAAWSKHELPPSPKEISLKMKSFKRMWLKTFNSYWLHSTNQSRDANARWTISDQLIRMWLTSVQIRQYIYKWYWFSHRINALLRGCTFYHMSDQCRSKSAGTFMVGKIYVNIVDPDQWHRCTS
jgi:hypothetical protein